MSELNMSSFIQTIQPGLVEHRTQESAGVFLLSAINDQEFVGKKGLRTDNLSSKKISRIVSRSDPVPDGISRASTFNNVVQETFRYFQDEVMWDMNPHLLEETVDNVVKLISNDKTIPDTKKDSLLKSYETGNSSRFLAEVFLYAVNRQNKKVNNSVECEDSPLLAEANYKCPLCHGNLVDTIKGMAIKKYRITKIFPEGLDEETASAFNAIYKAPHHLDSLDNMIALDESCSDKYLLNPTVEEYKKLCEIKKILTRNYSAKTAVNSIQLEDDIRTVLDALTRIRSMSELIELDYDALRLEEKFEPQNFILKNETQQQVVMYYRYIEKVFSESTEDFDIIASEIKLSSQKFEKIGLSQAEIIEELSEWIRNKSGLGSDGRLACDIVVSFFIQNCEVFHK